MSGRRAVLLAVPLCAVVLATLSTPTSAGLTDSASAGATFDAVPTLWWSTGSDGAGQFGDGTADAGADALQRVHWRPAVAIPRGVAVDSVAAGDGSACGIAAGRAYCWGDNADGQLGDGTTTPSADPVAVATADDSASALPADAVVTDISVGAGAACAVADGDVYCWGDNSSGRLGDDTLTPSTVPVAVATDGAGGSALLSGTATQVAVGGGGPGSTTSFTCAIADARAYCWGSRENGRLGDGVEGDIPSTVPIPVNQSWGGGAAVTALDLAFGAACAISNSRAYCWGSSLHGVLGNGENDELTDYTIPAPVETAPSSALPASAAVSAVAVGPTSACAVHAGDAYCWGTNIAGQLGADIATDTEPETTVVRRATAVARAGTGDAELPADATVRAIDVGGASTGAGSGCVLADRPAEIRRSYCWGDGSSGQLGLGGSSDQRVPQAAVLLPASRLPDGVDLVDLAVGNGFLIVVGAS